MLIKDVKISNSQYERAYHYFELQAKTHIVDNLVMDNIGYWDFYRDDPRFMQRWHNYGRFGNNLDGSRSIIKLLMYSESSLWGPSLTTEVTFRNIVMNRINSTWGAFPIIDVDKWKEAGTGPVLTTLNI